jgi:CelD/BcsL family acetyltransferase involved in cellulose biosynthesis
MSTRVVSSCHVPLPETIMEVVRIATAAEAEALAGDWNRLACGVPFRHSQWLHTWWRHYGQGSELFTLLVRDHGQAIGIAPWYLQRSRARGRVVRMLGSGEVCSDYLTLLCAADDVPRVAAAIADWLTQAARRRGDDRWDSIELDTVAATDPATATLVEELAERDASVHQASGLNCWRLELPGEWRAYQALLSKSHRKQVRRLEERGLDAGRAVLHTVNHPQQLPHARQILIDLHQRRRRALGEPGSFASARFTAFHEEAMQRMLAAGALRLHWLELDGTPAAAEYHLAGGGVIYGYQSGVDPARLEDEPGRLAAIATLRLAIEEGFQAFDFLRGDEPYKAHWRAAPQPTTTWRIAAPRPVARLRQAAWQAGQRVKAAGRKWRGKTPFSGKKEGLGSGD